MDTAGRLDSVISAVTFSHFARWHDDRQVTARLLAMWWLAAHRDQQLVGWHETTVPTRQGEYQMVLVMVQPLPPKRRRRHAQS